MLPNSAVQVQEKLRAIIGEPEMLLQMNSALQAAPAALPAPAAAPPDVARALHAHLQDGGWRHIAQQRRAAERLAASTAATTAKTFRPREVRERPELTLEAILGYEFKDKALADSCLVHSCALGPRPAAPAAATPRLDSCVLEGASLHELGAPPKHGGAPSPTTETHRLMWVYLHNFVSVCVEIW